MTQEQIRAVLERAGEIQSHGSLAQDAEREMEELVRTAEEVGLQREAVMQALRERLSVSEKPLEPGATVFAKSADGCFYPALVKELGEMTADVEFMSGGSARLSKSDLRPFQPLPGAVFNVPWPDWGWWNCKTVRFDADKNRVLMTDGWTDEKWFSVKEIRMKPEQGPASQRAKAAIGYLMVALGSGVAGAFIMRLLMR